MTTADILITGGTIVDGTGAPGRPGTVVVEGDRLRVLEDGVAIEPGLAPDPAGRIIDATRPGRRAWLHRPPLALGADDHGRAAPRAEGPAGRHDRGHRRGRQLVRPFRSADDLRDFARLNAGLDGLPEIALDWGTVACVPGPARPPGEREHRVLIVGNSAAAHRCDRLGGRACRRRAPTGRCRPCSARRWRRAPSGSAPGSTTRQAATPRPMSWRRSAGRPHGTAASITPTSATRSVTASSTRSAKRSRSAGEGTLPSTSRTSTTARPSQAPPTQMLDLIDDARAIGQDVTFDAYPVRVGEHEAADPDPDLGPVGRSDQAPRSASPNVGPATGSARPPGAGRPVRGRRRRARHPDRVPPPGRRISQWEGRTLGELIDATAKDPVDALCDLLIDEDLQPNEVTPGPHIDGIRPFLRHSIGMVGTDSTFVGAKPSPRTYGTLPADPRPVRPRRGAARP